MIKRSVELLACYAVGSVLVLAWSLSHVLGGTVTTENAAGVIVLPLAWLFGFWPTVMPLVVAHRIWRLQSTLETWCERRAAGVSTAEPEAELEDTLTLLAAEENGVPQRFVRPLVRRFLDAAHERGRDTAPCESRAEGGGGSIAGRGRRAGILAFRADGRPHRGE